MPCSPLGKNPANKLVNYTPGPTQSICMSSYMFSKVNALNEGKTASVVS